MRTFVEYAMPVDLADLSVLWSRIGISINTLHICNSRFENSIDDDTQAAIDSDPSRTGKLPPAVVDYILELDLDVGNAFRYSLFIAACTLHVQTLALYARFAISDYEADLKRRKGSDVAKHAEMLRERLGITFDAQLFERLDDLRIIRNFLIHDWGNLAEGKDAENAYQASLRINALQVACFGRNHDVLFLDNHAAVPFAIDTATDLNDFLRDEFKKLP
jgi:hypothetical protein